MATTGALWTTPLKVALYTAAPSDTGGGTEVSGGSYARASLGAMTSSSGGATSNVANIVFPQASGSWGTVTHFAIFDSNGTPKFIVWGALTTPQLVSTGVNYSIPAGQLNFSLS